MISPTIPTIKAHQPDLFSPDFNLVSDSAPDPEAWTVAGEAERREAIRTERARQTQLPHATLQTTAHDSGQHVAARLA